jgi:hypothetical protein
VCLGRYEFIFLIDVDCAKKKKNSEKKCKQYAFIVRDLL